MLKRFDKSKADLFCQGTIFGAHVFTSEMEGYLDELVWGFLKKGMKVFPHKHPQKEVYLFLKGRGIMQVNDEKTPVMEGDVVFIPPNSMHTAWNDSEEDLEFILVRSKSLRPWARRFANLLSSH
jgi:mannose-6-phosphate isomerase-like protein (cupin superfamily)